MEGISRHRGDTGGRQEDAHSWSAAGICLCKKVDAYRKVEVGEEQ